MNDDYDLEDLPPLPTLRRQNAVLNNDDLNRRFFDTKTNEIVYGNLDLTHSSNKNLVQSFFGNQVDATPTRSFNLIIVMIKSMV